MFYKIFVSIFIALVAVGFAIYRMANTIELPIIEKKKEIIVEEMTLEKIFNESDRGNGKFPEDDLRVLLVTGDVLLARSVNFKTVTNNNYKWPFEKTAEILRNADVVFVNLETPLIDDCPLTNEGMIFCGDPKNIEGLIFSGVDIVNVANNHTSNYGEEGLRETVEHLRKNNFMISGFEGPTYENVKGRVFAFLGYNEVDFNDTIDLSRVQQIESEIIIAKKNADIIIVQFHWGNEYTTQISQKQKALAYLAINKGADLVVGNHPHWIQPVEIYKGKVISYGHGNFVFDQEWSKKTKEGVIGKYTFYKNDLIDVEFLPIQIDNYGQPYFLDDDRKRNILEEMMNNSLSIVSNSTK